MIEKLKPLFTLPVVLAALGAALLMCALTGAGLAFTRPASLAPTAAGAALTIIPNPTATPYLPTPTIAPTATTPGEPPTPLPGVLAVGAYVQIYGTNGAGLNIRRTPGLNAEVQFLGYDSEVFVVTDGPQEQDGLTWWYIVTPVDESRAGWAAANYLSVVPKP
ncbi:MAG: hypothetical protein HYZ26_13135 [Chloroflexi bacterium]|nr:hypothetical protein [Chloroflexota bacterium]